MSDLTLGVVITNYETWELTARCVERILACQRQPDALLVVDDGSSSPPPEDLARAVAVRVNPENLGLVRSLNLGVRSLATDFVVLFDSDAHPLGSFVEPVLSRFAADPRLAILGFATVDHERKTTGSSEPEPGLASLVLGQRLHALWQRLRDDGAPLCVFTCAMAVRRSAFEELGGFDEDFDWLDLDHDLCMRAHRSGWHVATAPEIVAFHQGSGAPQATSQRVLRFYKNRWRLLRKFGKIRHPRLVRALVLGRLWAEYAVLRLSGWFSRSSALPDKLKGRRAVIDHCLLYYR